MTPRLCDSHLHSTLVIPLFFIALGNPTYITERRKAYSFAVSKTRSPFVFQIHLGTTAPTTCLLEDSLPLNSPPSCLGRNSDEYRRNFTLWRLDKDSVAFKMAWPPSLECSRRTSAAAVKNRVCDRIRVDGRSEVDADLRRRILRTVSQEFLQ
jgi:hypothetical protein